MEIDYIRVHDLNDQLIFSDEFDSDSLVETIDESEDENVDENVDEMSWDLDGNGVADALTDGLILLRSTFDVTGDALLNGAVSSEILISNEQIIENTSNVYQIADIDGNGEVDALTDSLILLRYLFGNRNNALIDGAIPENATRTSASEIEAYIQSHMP
jgi:hypothetical protein